METPNKMIGGIAGAMAQQPGTIAGAVQPQQGAATGVGMLPPPSSLVNSFNTKDQATMAMAYGGAPAPGSFFRMEGDSPIDQNAFFAALQDAKESGAKTFNVDDKTFPVK
jgi:hypothetical protein